MKHSEILRNSRNCDKLKIVIVSKRGMDMTKEIERAELHRAIWQIANDLRGSVDGWDFKQYVLGFLFYRFASENLVNFLNSEEKKVNKTFDYSEISDEKPED